MNKKIKILLTALAVTLLSMVSVPSAQAAMGGDVQGGAGVRFVEEETGTTDSSSTDSSSSSSSTSSSSHSSSSSAAGNNGNGSNGITSGGKTYFPATGEVAGGGLLLVIGGLIIGYVIYKKRKMQQP